MFSFLGFGDVDKIRRDRQFVIKLISTLLYSRKQQRSLIRFQISWFAERGSHTTFSDRSVPDRHAYSYIFIKPKREMQEDTDSSKMDSIRSQEQIYEKQIKNTYKQHLNLFITHSSDLLHLNIVQKEHQERKYSSLSAKTGFSKFDTICEIRGSVIGFDKLKGLLESKTVQRSKLPLLLSLSVQNKYLISPKNISKFAFNNPLYRSTIGNHDKKQYQNCYIQAHYGCKLFLTTSRDIPQNQQLILQQKSYDKFVFNPGQVPSEFP